MFLLLGVKSAWGARYELGVNESEGREETCTFIGPGVNGYQHVLKRHEQLFTVIMGKECAAEKY